MSWALVGLLEDIPKQGARVLKQEGSSNIAVFRTLSDDVFALVDKCPHRGGPLSQGIVHSKKVTCPLHGWNIHLDTGEAAGPDVGCTKSFNVKVEDGKIYIDLCTQIL